MSFWYTILTRNSPHLVGKLIASIREAEPQGDYKILVVDNGSAVPYAGGCDKLVITGQNLPYAVASNFGVREAADEGAKLVCVLSDDVEFKTPHLSRVREIFADRKRPIAFVGPRTVYPDGSLQSSGHTIPVGAAMARNLRDDVLKPRAVLSVIGSCVFTEPECWELVGGFDESLQYFHEDVALGLNAWTRGFEVWYEPGVTVLHHEGATRGNDLVSKMATETRRKCFEAEARSQALFERRIREGFWDLDKIRGYVDEANK